LTALTREICSIKISALLIGAVFAQNSRPVDQSKSAIPYLPASSGSNQPMVLQGIMTVDMAIS
jgi:hypothetical protein